MFEKRPIWGIIVGLNVCVLIWLISVQEPVMYDASTAIITSGMQQQQHQQLVSAASSSSSVSELGALSSLRGSRQDRDIKEKPPKYSENWASALTTFNLISRNYSINLQHATILKNRSENIEVKTTTSTTTSDAISLLTGSPSLTSSLGTGWIADVKVSPTPSWKKLTAVSSVLPNEDFNRLIDLQHFHYLVPQPVCSSEIQALILVHSAPGNHEKRQIIRDTWASIGRHSLDAPLRVLFLLGAVQDQQLQNELLLENNQYADIIQGSFVDDYRNMTYKHVMGFKWFLYNCPQARILVKVDDDVYVNTPQLLKYLGEEQKRPPPTSPSHQQQQQQQRQQKKFIKDQKNPKSASNNIIVTTTKDSPSTAAETTKTSNFIIETLGIFTNSLANDSEESATATPLFNASENLFHRPQNLLFCQKIIGSLVKRSYRSKWRVGFKEYAGRYYPPYCPGYAIIYSPDVIFRLYTAAQTSKYFWIDDVHITGVLAQQTNTTITTSSRYVLYSNECDRLLTGKTDLNAVEFLFAWHSITAPQIKALWHLQIMANNNSSSASDLAASNHQKADNISSSFIWTSNDRLSYNISNTLVAEEGLR